MNKTVSLLSMVLMVMCAGTVVAMEPGANHAAIKAHVLDTLGDIRRAQTGITTLLNSNPDFVQLHDALNSANHAITRCNDIRDIIGIQAADMKGYKEAMRRQRLLEIKRADIEERLQAFQS